MNWAARLGKFDSKDVITPHDLMMMEIGLKAHLNRLTVDDAWVALELTSKLDMIEDLRAWLDGGKPGHAVEIVRHQDHGNKDDNDLFNEGESK